MTRRARIQQLVDALQRIDEATYYLPHINEALSDSTPAEIRAEANEILDAIVAERPVWGNR